jgi:RNA polymerase sigma-70 factor (ECF subfamily)
LGELIVSNEDRHWCEALYQSKAADLVLYGRALGLSHCEAEDVLQETFIALMALESEPRQPVYYCLRSFRNRALNYRRSLWRRLSRELESSRWFERSEGETAEERQAMKSLAQLPSEQREVIVLKIWHRHTFDEIGQLLDISPNTIAGRYRYGIEKMRAAVKREEEYELEPTRDTLGLLDTPSTVTGH